MTSPVESLLPAKLAALRARIDAGEPGDSRLQLEILEAICLELEGRRPRVPDPSLPRKLSVGIVDLDIRADDRPWPVDWVRGRGLIRLDPLRPDGTLPARVLSFGVVLPPGLAGIGDTTLIRFIGLGAPGDGLDPLTGRGKLTSWVWMDNALIREIHGEALGVRVEEEVEGFDFSTGAHRAGFEIDLAEAAPDLASALGVTVIAATASKDSKYVQDDYEAFRMWYETMVSTILGELLPGLGEALSVALSVDDFACAIWLTNVNRKMTELAQAMLPEATIAQLRQYEALRQARERLMRICDP